MTTITRLILRLPERETEYDKLLDRQCWYFEFSDGSLAEASLSQSQINLIQDVNLEANQCTAHK